MSTTVTTTCTKHRQYVEMVLTKNGYVCYVCKYPGILLPKPWRLRDR